MADECGGNDDGAETRGDADDGDVPIASVGVMIIFASFVALFSNTSRAQIIDLCALSISLHHVAQLHGFYASTSTSVATFRRRLVVQYRE